MGAGQSSAFSDKEAVHHGLFIIDNSYRMYIAGIIKKEDAAASINAVLGNIINLKADSLEQQFSVFGSDSDIVHINVVLNVDGNLYSFIATWSKHPNDKDAIFSTHTEDSINENFHDNSEVMKYAVVPYLTKDSNITVL